MNPAYTLFRHLLTNGKQRVNSTDFINYNKLEAYKDFGGIRLEDDVLITDTGSRILGDRIPIEADDVEKNSTRINQQARK